jgi:quinol monooxygenase YgiN
MIYVIASTQAKEGKLQELVAMFKANATLVRQEKGCVQYIGAVDADAGLPMQKREKNVMTVLEKWESPDALREHLVAPHMKAYSEKRKDLVEGTTVRVLEEV